MKKVLPVLMMLVFAFASTALAEGEKWIPIEVDNQCKSYVSIASQIKDHPMSGTNGLVCPGENKQLWVTQDRLEYYNYGLSVSVSDMSGQYMQTVWTNVIPVGSNNPSKILVKAKGGSGHACVVNISAQ